MTCTRPFWPSPTSRALRGDPESQVVAAWLHEFGHFVDTMTFPATPAYISADTGLPSKEIARALDVLVGLGVIHWDETLGVIVLLASHTHARDTRVRAGKARRATRPGSAVLQ
jgi:hypothetical protein